jgi:hypothetical protein
MAAHLVDYLDGPLHLVARWSSILEAAGSSSLPRTQTVATPAALTASSSNGNGPRSKSSRKVLLGAFWCSVLVRLFSSAALHEHVVFCTRTHAAMCASRVP